MTKKIILKIGGSLLVPDGRINKTYVRSLCDVVLSCIEKGAVIFLQVGGGSLSRMYIDAAKTISKTPLTHTELDWLALQPTHLNAHLFLTVLRDYVHPTIITDYTKIEQPKAPIIIAAGWKPGHSTDYNAVILARDYGVNTIMKLSNTDYIYDVDPRINSAALPHKNLYWSDYRKLIGGTWVPGQHVPFDPEAAKLSEKHNVDLMYVKGDNIANLKNAINSKSYTGTFVHN